MGIIVVWIDPSLSSGEKKDERIPLPYATSANGVELQFQIEIVF